MTRPDLIDYPTDYDYKLTVLGEPGAQQRHRSVLMPRKGSGKKAQGETWYRKRDLWINMYDPSANDKRDFLRLVKAEAPPRPMLGPLRVDIFLYWPFRKADYRTGKYAGALKPNVSQWKDTGKDRDNCDKLILDALTGTFWKNDSQVADGRIVKRYSEQPRTLIFITRIGKEVQNEQEEISWKEGQHDGDGKPVDDRSQEGQNILHGNVPIW